MRFVPRPDQLEAIESITAQLIDDDRTQAIMACGTGKTFVSQKAAERITTGNPDSLILVAVPNLVLVEQMIGEWNRQASPGHEFATLAVNSRRRGKGDEDEITDVALPDVTSSPKEIAAFMLEPGRKVVFSTYQSMAHISSALGLAGEGRPGFQLDLMVLDEAHRTAGVTRTDTPTAFKLALDNEKVPAAKRLFMTATPRISKMNRSESTAASASMDNPDLFGHRAITRSLSWAVSEDLLAPYRTYVVQVDDAMLQASLEANPQLRVGGKAASAQHVAAAIALAKNARINGLGGIITYSSTIAGAQEFGRVLAEVVATLPEDQKPAGKLTVNHINGGTPAEERARILETLDSTGRASGDWAVVTNCNCLVEGVNVPSMDAIMFVDPRKSLVSIVQAIGRPMRKDRNNPDKIATIVLPVFVGAHENVQDAIDGGAFEHVNQTITALRDVDDALSEKFVEHLVKRGAEETSEEREPKGALIAFTDSDGELLPGQPGDSVIRVMDLAGGLAGLDGGVREGIWADWHRGIETALVDDMADGWERGFAALRKFVEREGHARVSGNHFEDGHSLGQWVAKRRASYAEGALSDDQVERLGQISGWTWDALETVFDEGLVALQKFALREGHVRVPDGHLEDGYQLGRWVRSRRTEYNQGKIKETSISRLEAFEGWMWSAKNDGYSQGMSELEQFVNREGHASIPTRHVENGFHLGSWVTRMRHRHRADDIPLQLSHKLAALPGWTWDPRSLSANQGFKAMEAFVAREGHSIVPFEHVESGFNLGLWVGKMRGRHRGSTLDSNTKQLLESLPGWTWSPRDDAFSDGIEKLQKFIDREGHASVSAGHIEDDFKLGSWVSKLRIKYKANRMNREQVDALESLDGWVWDALAYRFRIHESVLKKYFKREGNLLIPFHHQEDSVRIGGWVSDRRVNLRKGKLPEAQIAALDAISPTWRNGALAPWESAPGVRKDEELGDVV